MPSSHPYQPIGQSTDRRRSNTTGFNLVACLLMVLIGSIVGIKYAIEGYPIDRIRWKRLPDTSTEFGDDAVYPFLTADIEREGVCASHKVISTEYDLYLSLVSQGNTTCEVSGNSGLEPMNFNNTHPAQVSNKIYEFVSPSTLLTNTSISCSGDPAKIAITSHCDLKICNSPDVIPLQPVRRRQLRAKDCYPALIKNCDASAQTSLVFVPNLKQASSEVSSSSPEKELGK